MKWYKFEHEKGSRQKRPPVKRYVLVLTDANSGRGGTPVCAVGYMKNAAGDKQSPYFVVPGVGGTVLYWSDCLGDDFETPGIPIEDSSFSATHRLKQK